ncbi:hypothetical protein B0T22DRAFT_378440 [Podospora appendiculata]|uniref:Apple domain-containing protein n=1 Tax=Podospora appendiculata TaxID=314037 RepID=A0AAE0X8P8_9PEZI|nr:hypothetical protein B0T22DRAFT_378440 [Podospora appendiculata]
MQRRRLAEEGTRIDRRQDPSAPCPGGNGTQLGTVQQFTVLCNTNIDGDVIHREDSFSFLTCVDLCSSFHPKCEGVSFDGKHCQLRANLASERPKPARRFDGAIGTFPGATSNCPTLGGAAQVTNSVNYSTLCGTIIAGFDLGQNFAPTYQDCMGQCAATTGCAALSFDASQSQGFKNCYLKSAVMNSSATAPQLGIDSAMLSNAAQVASPAASPASAAPSAAPTSATAAPATTPNPAPASSNPGVATIPVPQPSSSGAAVVFFTPPPGGSTPVASAPSSPDAANTASVASPASPAATPPPGELPLTSTRSSGTGLLPLSSAPLVSATRTSLIPLTASSSAAGVIGTSPNAAAVDNGSGDSSSKAWIAAPVVGSIAAIALIVLSFIMLKRRRGARGRGRGSRMRASPVTSLFSTWLPGSPGRGRRKMTGMGNFSEVTGKQMPPPVSRGSIRNSVATLGFLRPAGGMERLEDEEERAGGSRAGSSAGEKTRDEVTPVYEIKNGKAELRSSLNGLGQNRWS